jgi:hypothetical protein
MTTRTTAPLAALLIFAAAPAQAQISVVNRTSVESQIHLTFGHLCEDTFVLRNEGDQVVEATLGVEKGNSQVPVTLAAREQIEFKSASKEDAQLWVGGKLVAKAEKQRRKCSDVQGNASVAIAPLEVETNDNGERRRYMNYPYFDPFFYGAAGWGWGWPGYGMGWGSPFARGFVGVPIIVAPSRGGRRR